MAMQTTSRNTEGEPMMEINMTPLIDVMLVLLIMFIITIPLQTHAVKLDLPQNHPNDIPPPVDPVKNKIVVTQAGRSCGTARRSTRRSCASSSTRRSRWTRCPSFTSSPSPKRATSWSTRCSPSPSTPMSRRWGSSATKPI